MNIEYISRDDSTNLIYKINIDSKIQSLIKEKDDLFRFCGFEDICGFIINLNDEEKIVLFFSDASYLGCLKVHNSFLHYEKYQSIFGERTILTIRES